MRLIGYLQIFFYLISYNLKNCVTYQYRGFDRLKIARKNNYLIKLYNETVEF